MTNWESFKLGYAQAVGDYAIWKDGEQLVGIRQRPLKDVLDSLDTDKNLRAAYNIAMRNHEATV